MAETEFPSFFQITISQPLSLVPRGGASRGSQDGELRAQTLKPETLGALCDSHARFVAYDHISNGGPRLPDALAENPLGSQECVAELPRVVIEIHAQLHDLHALSGREIVANENSVGEAIHQLRTKDAFLRVHGTYQDILAADHARKSVPLHAVLASRGGVENEISEMIGEKVDLIDVEDPAVGFLNEAGTHLPL